MPKSTKNSIKSKDYFGSKRNEIRYNRLKKRGINNPLNIMNRAIINLNNSMTNSESSQEHSGNYKNTSTTSVSSKCKNAEKKTNSTVAFKTNYEDIINSLHQKQKQAQLSSVQNKGHSANDK